MTRKINNLNEIASTYDVIVFDQWGVLHNGATPYPGAVKAIDELNTTAAVLSNSGKRADINQERITHMGFQPDAFDIVMTSGEALWRDVEARHIKERAFLPIERALGDAADWAEGLNVTLTNQEQEADAILLMGLPDGDALADWETSLVRWAKKGRPLYCSNPDRQSPREGGLVISPGTLAFRYRELGGAVAFYGKPHLPVFQSLQSVYGSGRYLMVGDSLEHDIAGAQAAGWDSLLIQGGLYATEFASEPGDETVLRLAREKDVAPPTYRMDILK